MLKDDKYNQYTVIQGRDRMIDKKRVLKEFQWFQVQTKVRQLVVQFLQPFEKKISHNTSSISKLNESTKEQREKLQQITMMVYNDQNIFENGIFSNIRQKFHHQSIHIKELQNKIEVLEGYVNDKVQVLDKRLEESTEVLTGINSFKADIQKQMQNQATIIIESQSNIFTSFAGINKHIAEYEIKLNSFQSNLSISNLNSTAIEQKFKALDSNIQGKILGFQQTLKQIKETTNINQNALSQVQSELKRLDKFESINRKLQTKINEEIMSIEDLLYKIEVLQPLISFTQINEYAHKILPQKYHKNISIYYYNKYNELIEEILNNNYEEKRVKESVKSNMENIKQTHKKAIKQIFKIKKDMLLDMGIDINLCSHQKKDEYLQSIKLEQNLQNLQQDQGEQKKKKKKLMAEQQQLGNIKNKITSQVIDIKERILIQIKDSKKYIQSVEELLSKNINHLQKKVDKVEKDASTNHIDHQLKFKSIDEGFGEVNKKVKLEQENGKSNKVAIKNIQNILNILSEIEKQDEKDRLAISLLGIKETHRDEIKVVQDRLKNKKVVDLDQDCLSCTGNPNYYNQFFKMACLTYNSSPVPYNHRQYQRLDILQLLENQLKHLSQNLQQNGDKVHKNKVMQSSRYQKSNISNELLKINSTESKKIYDSSTIRNIASSQQIRSNNKNLSSQDACLISPNELTTDVMKQTRNRFYSRKIEAPFRESMSRKQHSSSRNKERNSYMMHVSHFFRQLKKHNEETNQQQ